MIEVAAKIRVFFDHYLKTCGYSFVLFSFSVNVEYFEEGSLRLVGSTTQAARV